MAVRPKTGTPRQRDPGRRDRPGAKSGSPWRSLLSTRGNVSPSVDQRYASPESSTMVPMRREIERLLKQADRDLENARKNLSIEAYEVAAFLAQQAVEK